LLACLQSALYSCALPLWEGFDEPFHYAYVESILFRHEFPVLNRTTISREISRSLVSVPTSRLLSASVPGGSSFEQWAKMPQRQRHAREELLSQIGASDRSTPGGTLNYEAQQAPLTYLLLAPFDYVLGAYSLRTRILFLRLIVSVSAALVMYFGLRKLSHLVQLDEPLQTAAIFFILQVQMLWASIAHVGNDALAVPLTLWFCVALGRTRDEPTAKHALEASALLCAGLLTKAYFLTFVPAFLGLLIVEMARQKLAVRAVVEACAMVVVAAPWYVRNLWLYGSLEGTQQGAKGIGFGQAVTAVGHIPWLRSTYEFAHWSLWTGNWSFTSFSQATLNAELLLLAAGLIGFLVRWRSWSGADRWIVLACVLFACGLVYQTCVTWVESHGQAIFPEPWYAQGILAVLLVLCFKGYARGRFWGRIAAGVLTLFACWVMIMTYAAKLLPYYGAAITHANARVLWNWWTAHPRADLAGVTAAPPTVVFLLLAAYLVLLFAAAVSVCTRMRSPLTELTERF
jgi:hypothetical protein